MKFCPNCGAQINGYCNNCPNCGIAFTNLAIQQAYVQSTPANAKSRVCAGLLALFLGPLGVHNFYLGYIGNGVTQLILTLVLGPLTCGAAWVVPIVWSFIEGIMLLCGSIKVDGNGYPLGE